MPRSFIDEYDLTGFHPGAPSPEAAAIDARVCAEGKCNKCGHVGLEYRPYTGNGYRAFAVCPVCHHAEEF